MRQAEWTKKTQALAKHRDILEPLISGGAFDNIRPILERAVQDPGGFGQFIYDAWQRVQQGKPLAFSDGTQPAASAAATTAPAPAVAPTDLDALLKEIDSDVYLDPTQAEALKKYVVPLATQLMSATKTITDFQTEQTATKTKAQEDTVRKQQVDEQAKAIYGMFRNRFPTQFQGGPDDFRYLNELREYAVKNGYFTPQIGLAAAMMSAHLDLEAIKNGTSTEVIESTAARSLAEEEQRIDAAAKAATIGVAGAATTGTSAAPATNGQIPARPSRKNADGTLKPSRQILKEQTEWAKKYRQPAA
jgi:hypothetical protein